MCRLRIALEAPQEGDGDPEGLKISQKMQQEGRWADPCGGPATFGYCVWWEMALFALCDLIPPAVSH